MLGFAIAYGFVAAAGAIDGHDVLGVIPIDTKDTLVHTAYVALGVIALGAARRIQLK